MASENMLSDGEAKVFIPSPLWWHPSARWVAISHLPSHLHNHATLASLVAHFGTFISFSYPANLSDKKVVMVLVGNCFITKVPHILPVKEGEKVFPVRIHIVFQTKISGEGIIFDPYDFGDDFCRFFSGGQCPPPLQQGSTFPLVPAILPHVPVRDKNKASVKSRVKMPHFNTGTSPLHVVSHQVTNSLFPSARGSVSSSLANIGQTLTPALNKFVSEVSTSSRDNDLGYQVKSHHTFPEVSLPADSGVSQSRKRNLAEAETASWSHFMELCSKTLHPHVKVDQTVADVNLNLHSFRQHGKSDSSLGTTGKQSEDYLQSLSTHKLNHSSDSQTNIDNVSTTPSDSLVKEPTQVVIQSKVKETKASKKETAPELSLLANPPLVFRRKKSRQVEADWKLKQWDTLPLGEDKGP